jgi:hypothetical protein
VFLVKNIIFSRILLGFFTTWKELKCRFAPLADATIYVT